MTDQERELELAQRQIDSFLKLKASVYHDAYRKLLYYAALPLVLTPELLHYLRVHFVREAPWIAEADILLYPELCVQKGYEQFAMQTAARAFLLSEARTRLDIDLPGAALLLVTYIRELDRTAFYLSAAERDAQAWAAMVYLGEESREEVAEQIAQEIKAHTGALVTPTEASGDVVSGSADRLDQLVHLINEMRPELKAHTEYQDLLDVADVMAQLLYDPDGSALRRLRESGVFGRSYTVGGVDVTLPDLAIPEDQVETRSPELARVRAGNDAVMVRAQNHLSNPVVGVLPPGETAPLLGIVGNWYRVQLNDKVVGFVAVNDVSVIGDLTHVPGYEAREETVPPEASSIEAAIARFRELIQAGQSLEAGQVVRALVDATHRSEALRDIASSLAQAGSQEEALYAAQKAVDIDRQWAGARPDTLPELAWSLNSLAEVYRLQERYREAELLYREALEIRQRALGREHPDVAQSLNNLAELYRAQGDYEQALPYLEQSLVIWREIGDKAGEATALNALGQIYQARGDYDRALVCLEQSLDIWREIGNKAGEATALNNLAELYRVQRRYRDAEPLYQQALAIREQVLGGQHPDVAQSLNNLAMLYVNQGQHEAAVLFLQRAVSILQRSLGDEDPDTQILKKKLEQLKTTTRQT